MGGLGVFNVDNDVGRGAWKGCPDPANQIHDRRFGDRAGGARSAGRRPFATSTGRQANGGGCTQ